MHNLNYKYIKYFKGLEREYNMASKSVLLTYEGIKTLEGELENLKTVRRNDVAE